MVTTAEQYIHRLQSVYGLQGSIAKLALEKPAKELLSRIKSRIQQEGKNSNDGQIGQYSTKPIYATRKQFAHPGAFQPDSTTTVYVPYVRGGKARMRKNKKETMFLPHGYKQLRDIQGMQTAFVDSTYTGKTMRAYQMQVQETEILMGMTTGRASLIREKMEHQFKSPIYSGSRSEIEAYKQGASFRINRLTVGVLEGTLNPQVLTPDYSFTNEPNLPF